MIAGPEPVMFCNLCDDCRCEIIMFFFWWGVEMVPNSMVIRISSCNHLESRFAYYLRVMHQQEGSRRRRRRRRRIWRIWRTYEEPCANKKKSNIGNIFLMTNSQDNTNIETYKDIASPFLVLLSSREPECAEIGWIGAVHHLNIQIHKIIICCLPKSVPKYIHPPPHFP